MKGENSTQWKVYGLRSLALSLLLPRGVKVSDPMSVLLSFCFLNEWHRQTEDCPTTEKPKNIAMK